MDDTQTVLKKATDELVSLIGHTIDVITISSPPDTEYADLLAKTISKLSPLMGNMIEYAIIKHLNSASIDSSLGTWKRQDPGFPDAIFDGSILPKPGIEIKTWFPLATEITARFKDSVSHFDENQTNVAVVAWLPEYILFGKPKIIDIFVDSAKSVAQARDRHYHKPPGYLVVEPEDTSLRTINLQQTNTNGYKFQGTVEQLVEAKKYVDKLGKDFLDYKHKPEYQIMVKALMNQYPYRLDTNFAKIDRIEHSGLEEFKVKVLATTIQGHTVAEWTKLLHSDQEEVHSLLQDLVK
jgi:hypothetical protein